MELLEKAKKKNLIVYLGTGSGKTFIAVMLIRHMRDMLMLGKRVVFLCNNVALLEQQASVIAFYTGLETGSYSGSHGRVQVNRMFIMSHSIKVLMIGTGRSGVQSSPSTRCW